jgi:hypothetical protein
VRQRYRTVNRQKHHILPDFCGKNMFGLSRLANP